MASLQAGGWDEKESANFAMSIFRLDPRTDPRWHELLELDERASVFHTAEWLEALRRSYGYEPVVFTTSKPQGQLKNAIVFCRVLSWLTGRRLVSLPFSDHCQPLIDSAEDLAEIMACLKEEIDRGLLKYVELRPLHAMAASPSDEFCFHVLDLSPNTEKLFQQLHKDSIRRKIQRAEREGLSYEAGTSRALLKKFYPLFVATRARHGLPPSPFHWFTNLADCMGQKVRVRIASKGDQPVAGTITLSYKNSVVYKYGASDARLNNLGGMPFLMWMTIQEAKSEGFQRLDFGRSDTQDAGLITFKDRLGGVRSALHYWRWPDEGSQPHVISRSQRLASMLMQWVPNRLQIEAGNLLCRHFG